MLKETVIAISAALASICLEQMYVIGDGNCYFRCISKYLFVTEVILETVIAISVVPASICLEQKLL